MQKKRINTNNLLDKLHRGAVLTCVGVTICGMFVLGSRIYQYYTVIKPERQKAELQKLIMEDVQDPAIEIKY